MGLQSLDREGGIAAGSSLTVGALTSTTNQMHPQRHWQWDILTGVAVYAVTTLPVLLGLILATTPGVLVHDRPTPSLLGACCYFDGGHYRVIVHDGYSFDPAHASNVAFFPGYPLAAQLVRWLTGCGPPAALVLVSNAAFAVALILLSAYLRIRFPDDPPRARLTTLVLLGLWPIGFFFRIGYSESLFLVVIVLLLLGFARRWPITLLALIAGAATGIRPVGVAATAAVVVHVLLDTTRGSPRRRLVTAALLVPLGCWGLLAYMGYQQVAFGDPLAFARTQQHWMIYHPPDDAGPLHKWVRLAVAEPIWNNYVPGSQRHWSRIDRSPLLGLAFWNPLVFVFGLGTIAAGWALRWLTPTETVLALGLLVIPYLARGYEMSMVSQARFASVVIPVYIVIGRAISRWPPVVIGAVLVTFAPVLALWTALFAATWPLF